MSQAKSANTTAERLATAYAELAAFLPTFEAAIARCDQEISRRTGIAPHWNFGTDDEAKTHLAVQTIVEEEMGIVDLGKKLDARPGESCH
jgi:hypothetical protein